MYILLYAASRGPFSSIGTGLVRENLHTVTSPLSTPQSVRKLEIINEGYNPDQDENIVESSFTESASAMEYRIRLEEDIELFTDGHKTMVSLDVCRITENT